MRRRRNALLFIALAVLIMVPISGAYAQTGNYQVFACNDAAEGANNSWVWSTTDPSRPVHYAEHVNCPDRLGGNGGKTDQEGGLSTTDALGLSDGAPPGSSAGWTFTAPTGTTITGIAYERYIGHIFDSSNYWSPALRTDGTVISGETCLDTIDNGESCFVGGPPGEGGEPGNVTSLSAHQLTLGIACEAHPEEECITGATEHGTWATMYGSTVTISDPTPPTLSTPTGTLWEPSETGFHIGTQNVAVAAEDIGGGVQSIVLAADDHLLQTYTAACDFTHPQPCPSAIGTHTFTLPTTQLSDGTHTLTLTAIDAAGNKTTISQQITVVNEPPPPPIALTAVPAQPGSSTFTATWTDPSGQTAPITAAIYQICPSNQPDTCSTPKAAPANGPATVTAPGPGVWTLAVWLANAAGLSSPTDAAHTTFTVSAPGGTTVVPGRESTDSGGLGGGIDSPSRNRFSSPKTTLHLAEALRGHELVVHVTGPATGRVSVSYTGHYRGHTIAYAVKTVTLAGGHRTVTFKLSAFTAAHARIRVSAKLGDHPSITSKLHRFRHTNDIANTTRQLGSCLANLNIVSYCFSNDDRNSTSASRFAWTAA